MVAPKHESGPDEFLSDGPGIKDDGSGSPAGFHRPRLENGYGGEYDELGIVCPPHTTERKLMTRIDLHILPFISLLYLLAFLDRVNIANAKAFGLTTDLGLGGVEYNTILTIFFVPCTSWPVCILASAVLSWAYFSGRIDHWSSELLTLCADVFFEIPSNILLKKLSPRIWLSICGIGFGVVMVCQGLTQNYSGILATRFFLGLFECGMFPGCFYLLSMWYKRSEAQKRFTFFFCSTSLAGAFGGLLASAIGKSESTELEGFLLLLYIANAANSGRPTRVRRMAMDLHHRGCSHLLRLHRFSLCLPDLVSSIQFSAGDSFMSS